MFPEFDKIDLAIATENALLEITSQGLGGVWLAVAPIPYDDEDKNLKITALMKIKLLKRYKRDEFTFERLKSEYGILCSERAERHS